MSIHVVKAGETVSSIAADAGVDPVRLASDNSVPSNGALAVGQTLVIRVPQKVHTVAPGESLYSIASAYGVSVRQLFQNNWSLGGNPVLAEGQTLVISYSGERLGLTATNGYAYPFIGRELLNSEVSYLTYLTPFTYGITAQGNLLPLSDDALLAAARSHDTQPVMHLSTFTEENRFDTDRATMILTNYDMQTSLITNVEQTIHRKGYAGLDVDFEFLPANLAEAYAAFLARLQRLLSSQGYFVWSALAPKTSASQPGLLYQGHSYPAVGAAVDAVLLMTYEWGYTSEPAG